MDRKNVESIEKIRSKSPFLDVGGQVSICRGDKARISLNRTRVYFRAVRILFLAIRVAT